MRRRCVVAALLLVVLSPLTARAELKMLPLKGTKHPTFLAGIRTANVEFATQPGGMGRQRRTNWCWAACSQMILNYYGLPVSQEQVVAKIFGGALPDLRAKHAHILAALNGWAMDASGQGRVIRAADISRTWGKRKKKMIIDSLRDNKPLLVGLEPPGHVYLLTAVKYYFPKKSSPEYDGGDPVIEKVYLRDPWPAKPSRVTMSGRKFLSTMTLCVLVQVD